ncbi:unnamed protein product [Taenia asiatica]|uniref:CSN12-like protein n=1 Tax=Taenia asiatica TaxID=60517 RepID=A0A0R3W2U7_TAEAS|nr:unnamed protein product [Taenia asiatica]
MYKGEAASKSGVNDSFGRGHLLLLLSLGLDGLTGGMQEDFRSRTRVGTYTLMLNLNAWSLLYLAIAIMSTDEVVPFIVFVRNYPHAIFSILLFGVVSAVGQMFIYTMIVNFGSLMCSIVTTTRKFFTVFASVVLFGHTLSTHQVVGAVFVFMGLLADQTLGKQYHALRPTSPLPQTLASQTPRVRSGTKREVFSEAKEENWMLPVVFAAAVDLRRFAHALDVLSSKKVDDSDSAYGSHLERVAQAIMKLFQICAADSLTAIEDSKKRGMMGLANQLFKIYFQASNTCLTFAFERCLASNKANKRLILIYLIPVRMLLGILPYNALLKKYKLEEFEGISNAVKIGNLRKLTEELERNEAFFISCGIYLILEKLKMITYRNLFKRIAGILKTHLLPIPAFTEALKQMGVEDIDADETECILANLVYEASYQSIKSKGYLPVWKLCLWKGDCNTANYVFQGKIKGYLAHQQQKLVVSKIQPFPPL